LNTFVADASVAAKWLLPGPEEPFADEARRLLMYWTEGLYQLVVPDIFWTESANILWKATRRGRCTRHVGEAALVTLRQYKIPTVSSLTLLDSALQIAVNHGRTVYDSLYVSLAVQLDAQLITADEKLVNALPAYYRVKLLADI
jgi:predicted nucleic acid-binding protein